MEVAVGDRAIGYVRVSRVGGREGDSFLSPDQQRQSIERVSQREGLELVDVVRAKPDPTSRARA
jgi:DNA invertase Pin-like site-specific DNA recombinase